MINLPIPWAVYGPNTNLLEHPDHHHLPVPSLKPFTYHETSSPEPSAQHGMLANEAPCQVGRIPVRKEECDVGPSGKQRCSSEAQPKEAGATP